MNEGMKLNERTNELVGWLVGRGSRHEEATRASGHLDNLGGKEEQTHVRSLE